MLKSVSTSGIETKVAFDGYMYLGYFHGSWFDIYDCWTWLMRLMTMIVVIDYFIFFVIHNLDTYDWLTWS